MYDIGFQRHRDYKLRVCGKDSIPLTNLPLYLNINQHSLEPPHNLHFLQNISKQKENI